MNTHRRTMRTHDGTIQRYVCLALAAMTLSSGCARAPEVDAPADERGRAQTSALAAETVTATVEISNIPYDSDITPTNLFSQVLHANGKTWFVARDPTDSRPYVWQKADGAGTTATAYPIDTGSPTYTSVNDSHHNWSIGIDSDGYLHVMGDMHNYPYGPSPVTACGSTTPAGSAESSSTYLPTRLQCQIALYWKSNNAYDASGGFTFKGGSTSTAPNAVSITYPRFIHAPNGDLYFTSLGKAVRDSSSKRTGQMAVLLHKYNPGTGSWTALGASVSGLITDTPSAASTTYFPAFFWENGGVADGSAHPWFQGFQHQFRFDRRGTLHFCAAINVDPSSQKNTRLLYASSPDGGATWKRADGTTIGGLPLRAVGTSQMADLVTDTQDAYSLGDYTVVTADHNGTPACRAGSPSNVNNGWGQWFYWNGSSWTTGLDTDSLAGTTYGSEIVAPVGPDHNVTFVDTHSAVFRRTDTLTNTSTKSQSLLPDMWSFKTVSDKGSWDNGALYGVGFFGYPTSSLKIVRVTAVPTSTVSESYSFTTTTGAWDKGPYSLLAGQQLRMTVAPASGNPHNVTNELWTPGYGSQLVSAVSSGTTVTTYTSGVGAVATRIVTGVAGIGVNVTLERPAILEHASVTSLSGLQTRGPYFLKAGQKIRQEIYPLVGNPHNISNEIWNDTLTTQLASNVSKVNQSVEYTAPSDMNVYVGTYTGLASMTFNVTVVR